MDWDFMLRLDELRHRCKFPFRITSGYRHPTHPVEAQKRTRSGQHTFGVAADIRCIDAVQRYRIIKEATAMNFTGIGVAKSFVHVDDRTTTPTSWSY